MTVMILDLDWLFDKSDLPKPDCMKLSSFLKQKKHTVYFVGDMSELTMAYDKLYVFCDSDSAPMLAPKVLNDEKTVLFGKRFELCGAKTLGPVIMACRPDYLLYDITDEKSNSYTKANFVTFYTDSGSKIMRRQAWKNTKKGVKRTIVTDAVLWRQKASEIVECLRELKAEKNIMFWEPISLRCLVENEDVQDAFVELHFLRGTKFKWRNDLEPTVENSQRICDFINKLRKHTKSNLGAIPLRLECNNWKEDLIRAIQLVAVFKKNKCRCFFPPMKVPPHHLYPWLVNWMQMGHENSFVEEMAFFDSASKGTRWLHIVNDPQMWTSNKIRFLIKILADPDFQAFLPQLCIQWGGDSINHTQIDFKIINDNVHFII
jgi:hypothetical protein